MTPGTPETNNYHNINPNIYNQVTTIIHQTTYLQIITSKYKKHKNMQINRNLVSLLWHKKYRVQRHLSSNNLK